MDRSGYVRGILVIFVGKEVSILVFCLMFELGMDVMGMLGMVDMDLMDVMNNKEIYGG